MKSMRNQDIYDIGSIIKYKNIKSPKDLSDELIKLGFNDIDISILLEGFSIAYGMEWLENYYQENQEKINK